MSLNTGHWTLCTTQHLKRVRQQGNVREIMFALRLDLVRNIANIAKRCLGEGRCMGGMLGRGELGDQQWCRTAC